MSVIKEKLMLLKLKFRASKTKIFACFILFTIFSCVSLSLFPVKTSADNNYISVYKTARNITAGENNWEKTINANPGDKIAFSIRVDANGSYNVYNINVSDNLPGQLSYASGSTRIDGNFASDGIISGGINIGTIYNNQSKIITFEAYASSSAQYYGDTLINNAYAKADNANQQSDSAQIYIGSGNSQPTSLNIYKTVRNISQNENSWQKTTSANSGDRLAFQLQISTNNNTTANNAVATDNLPSQLSYVSGSTRIDGNYSASDNIVSNGLFIGSISPGQTKIITFEATMVSGYSYSYASALTNYAYVKAENINQQSDSAQIYLNNYQNYGQTYLTLKKSVQNTNNPNGSNTDNTAKIGDTLCYAFSYTNSGNTAVYNLKIVDNLPSYTSIISADNGGIYDERTNQITWNIGTISANGLRSGSVSYLVKILNPPASTIIRNSGIIKADNLPDVSSNEVRTTINSIIAAPLYQAPIHGKVIRVVTGANDILFNSAVAAITGIFTTIILYLIIQNNIWLTRKKLQLKILAQRLTMRLT